MADNKVYYYMRLKDNFFDTDELLVLESLQDGYLYSNILLKLYLRSLRDNGKLMFNNTIPYNPQMIATITRHQIGTIERALKIFQEMGLIEILDSGAIYMLNIQNYIGQASTEADRKREYRARIEREKLLDKCPDIPTPEIETGERDTSITKFKTTTKEEKEIPRKQENPFSLPTLDIPFIIYPRQVEKLSMEYPDVNVPEEIGKMKVWLEEDSSRLKPINKMNGFVTRWLVSNQSLNSNYPEHVSYMMQPTKNENGWDFSNNDEILRRFLGEDEPNE